MEYEEYMCIVKRRLNKHFNITDDIEEKGVKINLCANSIFIYENCINNVIAPFNNYEIYEKFYIKHFNKIDTKDIKDYFNFLHIIANEENHNSNHIHKSIVGVMVCDFAESIYNNYIKSLKHTKPYIFYFKGWNEVQLICVDLNKKNIFSNDAAKENLSMFTF